MSLDRQSTDGRPPLWVCHEHELIGNQQEAHGHQQAHGCEVVELSQETSDGVRRLWLNDQGHRVAGLIAVARMGGLKRA